jgi:hypothetical protein
MAKVSMQRGDFAPSYEYALAALNGQIRNGEDWFRSEALDIVRLHEVRLGNFREARERYTDFHPELLAPSGPAIDRVNLLSAIGLVSILRGTGEAALADRLLEESLSVIDELPWLGWSGFQFLNVRVLALQGRTEDALRELKAGINSGWSYRLWHYLKLEPDLDAIRDEPEFQAIFADVETQIAAQLKQVHAMERTGELAAIPERAAVK